MTDADSALSWLLYLQWAYAVWQWMRGWAVVRLVWKLPMWMIFYKPGKKKVILLNEVYEDLHQGTEAIVLRPGDEKNGIEIISKEGYWVKARLVEENEYIIAHQNQIAKLWCTDFHNQDFVTNKEDINDRICIASKLSKKDALLKIAGSHKTAEVHGICIYSPELSMAMDPYLGGFLATIPIFVHAKGFVIASFWISLVLLILDLLRTPLYKIYDVSLDYFSVFVMLHVFKDKIWFYRFFSLFSQRWAYGDKSKKCVYNGRDCGFLVSTVAVFKQKDDYELTFGYGDYQSMYPTPEDQHFVIRNERIYALPIVPRMGSYCKVVCKVDAVVAGKAGHALF